MDKIARIIDANCNRTREGMRVIEEVARFFLDDEPLFVSIKNLRHEFSALEKKIRSAIPSCVLSRDSAGDVGKPLIPELENNRAGISEIIEANCKRIEESLRVLEEFIKLSDNSFVSHIKEIRFKVYNIEKILKSGFLEK